MTKEKSYINSNTKPINDGTNVKNYDKTLTSLKLGEIAIVTGINAGKDTKRRFLDLGIVSGTRIKALYKSPYGDPVAYLIRGTVIALRSEDSRNISIS